MMSDPPPSDPPPSDRPMSDPDTDPYDVDLPPWSIWYAVRLMWAGAVLSLVGVVLAFATIDDVKRKIAADLRDQHKYSQHDVDALSQNLVASTTLGSLLAAVMWLWMARANRAGKRWARAIATTLGALNLAWFAVSITAEGVTVAQLVLSGLIVLVGVAVLALLWHRDSGDYYWFKSRRGGPTASSDPV
jgi:hypothetical protein